MKNYKLFLFLKKIDNYENGLIDKIKYYFEYELNFINKFKKFILYKSDYYSYYYIKEFLKYKNVELQIYHIPSINSIIRFFYYIMI